MNGELANLVALCLHGNVWLHSGAEPAPSLEAKNSTFKFVKRIQFSGPAEGLFTTRQWSDDGTAPWYRHLRKIGARRLSMVIPDVRSTGALDPQLAVFANGGRWAVASGGHDPILWRARWTVEDRDEPQRRIWAVHIEGERLRQPLAARVDQARARDDLAQVLHDARDFAEANALTPWDEWFSKTLTTLTSADPVIPYYPDLAPTSLDHASHQLLAAAVQAWVFGGMGSWNDIWLEDDDQSRALVDLTRRLYSAVLAAITAVTNSTHDGAEATP